ncbi:hypothetical protein NKG94_34050 [Micromonospora sp. M12]
MQVDHDLFRAVYDSPASLPGRHRWTTPESDVRRLEKLLGMPARSIGAPSGSAATNPTARSAPDGSPGTTSSRRRSPACTTRP